MILQLLPHNTLLIEQLNMQRGTKSAREKAWKAFSWYIRLRDDGRCVSCGVKKDPKEMHAGHFYHLGKTKLWLNELDEVNVNCQCPKCNTFLHGNLYNYGKFLERKYGEDIIKKLEQEKGKVHKHTPQEFKAFEAEYNERTKKYK